MGITDVLTRVAPLMEVARAAGEADPAMAELYRDLQRGRLANLEWFALALARNGPLRDGMDAKVAALILRRLASPDLFMLMRRVEGASEEACSDWLSTSIKGMLLSPYALMAAST